MNINRHNYEEFFLLWVDNELNVDQRREVERFVAANPDLKEELESLKDIKLPGDAMLFDDKSSLLRFTEQKPETINEENIQYWMLMHLDRELKKEEEKKLERFIQQNPSYQKEFADLKRTRLEANPFLVFPEKELLYKRGEKVVGFAWWRIAIAAAVILFISLTILLQFRSNKQEPRIVQQDIAPSSIKNKIKDKEASSLKENSNNKVPEIENISSNNGSTGKKTSDPIVEKNYSPENNSPVKRNIVKENYSANRKKQLKQVNAPGIENDEQEEKLKPAASNLASLKRGVKEAQPEQGELKIKANEVLIAQALPKKPDVVAVVPQPVVVVADEASSNSKKGLRGLLRTVGRTISRTTGIGEEQEDLNGKVLIAGLVIAKK